MSINLPLELFDGDSNKLNTLWHMRSFYSTLSNNLYKELRLIYNFYITNRIIYYIHRTNIYKNKNKFKDFVIDGNNIADNLIPGIPDQILDLELIFKLSKRRSLIISNRFIGERYADNLNERLISSYNLLNVKYSKQILSNSEIFLGANNIFNQDYYDNIRINAFGKRYYEPAPKRNFYFGINFSF